MGNREIERKHDQHQFTLEDSMETPRCRRLYPGEKLDADHWDSGAVRINEAINNDVGATVKNSPSKDWTHRGIEDMCLTDANEDRGRGVHGTRRTTFNVVCAYSKQETKHHCKTP